MTLFYMTDLRLCLPHDAAELKRFSRCLLTEDFSQCFHSRDFVMSRVMIKPVIGVSDQVRYKPGCKTTENGKMFQISDLESSGIVLSI